MLTRTALVVAASLLPWMAAAVQDTADQTGKQAPAGNVSVKLLEAGSGEKISFTGVNTPSLIATLTIENIAKEPLAGVEVELSRFVAPSGEFVDPVIEPRRFDLALAGIRRVTVYGTFLTAETFTAWGRILQGSSKPLRFSVEVTRARTRPAVEVGDPVAIQRSARVLRSPLTVYLPMTLYATGTLITLPAPVLHSAVRKEKADSASGELADAALAWTSPPAIAVTPGTPAVLEVPVRGLGSPGRYDLKLRFAKPGYEVIDKDVTVYVRDPMWLAVLLVFVGVVLSLLMRSYATVLFPNWQIEARVAGVVGTLTALEKSAIEQNAGAEARTVVTRVLATLKGKWDTARAQLTSDQLGLFEDVAAVLPDWVRLRTDAATARPRSVREKLLTELDDAAQAFQAFPLDAAKVAEAAATVRAFPRKRATEVAAELTTQLDKLEQDLQTLSDPAAIQIRQTLRAAQARLQQGRLDAALGGYDTARLLYATRMAAILGARLGPLAPTGVDPARWQALSTDGTATLAALPAMTDPDAAMDAVNQVAGEYLEEVAGGLDLAADKLKPKLDPAKVKDALATANKAIEENKFNAALSAVDKAKEEYQLLTTGSTQGAGAAGGAAAGDAFDALQAFYVPARADTLAREGARGRILDRLAIGNVLLVVVVVIAATLSGVQVLWVGNATWGGWASWLAAIGWGLAFDQFSILALSGLKKT